MSQKRKQPKQVARAKNSSARTAGLVAREQRRTYPITQRGVRTSRDLTEFHAAAMADVDSGAADLREMSILRALAGQIIAHENMKIRAGIKRNLFLGSGR